MQERKQQKRKEKIQKKIYLEHSGHFQHPIQYKSFLCEFKRIANTMIPTKDLKIGLHCFQKTAYLLGIWGKGEWPDLKYSARHLSDRHSQTYRQDANVLMHDSEILGCPDNAVSKWWPIRRERASSGARQNFNLAARGLGITGVASEWVAKSLNFPPSHPYANTQSVLVKAAHEYRRAGVATASEFASSVLGLSGEKMDQFLLWIQAFVGKDRQEQEKVRQGEGEMHEPIATNSPAQPIEPPKKKRKVGTEGLEGYLQVKEMPFGQEKVRRIVEICATAPKNTAELKEGPKTFLYRTARPVKLCLDKHHNGDVDAFCRRWEGLFKAKFGTACCGGRAQRAEKCRRQCEWASERKKVRTRWLTFVAVVASKISAVVFVEICE